MMLSVVVLAVGGAIWSFSQGAMTITAEDYAEDVIEMTDVISERFIIEMVWYDAAPITIDVMAEPVGAGDGVETVFSLDYFPVVSDETIYLDDGLGGDPVAQPYDGTVYTLVDDTGVITFVDPPGSEVAITADYDYLTNQLNVWIFNYGPVDIEVKVQLKDITCPAAEDEWIEIPSKDMVPFPTINLSANVGEELNIIAYTKRGNDAYYKYIVP